MLELKAYEEQQINDLMKKIEIEAMDAEDQSLEMINFAHTVTHKIKMNISQMPNQSIEMTRNSIVEFLGFTLELLEKILTRYYGEPICASIKLCNTQNTLKTFARGPKNVSSRGGRKKVKRLNSKSLKIGDNYAYDSILKRKFQYFAEGDLRNLSEKENDDDDSHYVRHSILYPNSTSALGWQISHIVL